MADHGNGNGNGIRITNREIYDEVVACRAEVVILQNLLTVEREKVNGMQTQVRLLWTLNFATVAALAAAGVKVFAT